MADKITRVTLIDDQPIFIDDKHPDLLGLEPFAKTLAGVALGTEGPFTIGVYGGWGVGKTSMLRHVKHLVERETEGDRDIVTVWFDPWQFECEEHPVFALIAAIMDSLPTRPSEWLGAVGKALKSMAYASSFEVGVEGAKAKLDASKALDKAEELSRGPLDEQIAYLKAYELLRRAGKSVGKGKIIVFIDDLDRCQPKTALKLLESVKLIFGQTGFIFFLAVDNEIIEGYLTHTYKQDLDLPATGDGKADAPYRFLAGRYLHKLVQMDFPLPTHVAEKFNEYLAQLTEDDAPDEAQRNELVTILRLGAAANPRSAVRLINRLRVQARLWDAMDMKTPAEAKPAQILLLMAFSDVLLDRLGPRRFEQLVENQTACDELLRTEAPAEGEAPPALAEPVREVVAPLRERRGTLDPLLNSDVGKLWLSNEPLRRAMHTFFQTIEAISEDREDQQVIIDRAIRNALKLAPGAPIPDEKRKEAILLDLQGQSDFGDAGMPLVAGLTSLQNILLSGTQVTDIGLAHLAGLTSLQGLDLDGTQVGDAGLAHLAGLGSLQWLRLAGTQVSDAGLAHLARLTSLEWLYLDGTQVTDTGLGHLAGLTSLQYLYLSGTQVSDAGLAHLAGLTGLQRLYLDNTQVSDAGLAHLAGLGSLRVLWLTGTQVGDAGLAHLAGLTSLQELDLDGTQVGDAGVEALQEQLPNCRIYR